jgi:hypothetical protein
MREIQTMDFLLGSTSFTRLARISGLVGLLSIAAPHRTMAFQVYNGPAHGNNLQINLTTTLSWTPIWRLEGPSAAITSDLNANDGDLANAHGMVSNLLEVLPVLDIKDGDFGAHFSLEAYLNPTYLGTNQATDASQLNYIVAKPNDYPSATRNISGENIRMLDAFTYGTVHFGADDNQTLTVRVGRETLLWGQSLYLANNGIAAGMAPIDVMTAENNPNAQTQQIIEPTGQIDITYQPNQVITFQGFYRFQWQPDYFPGAGSFFNTSDLIVPGASRLLFVPGYGAPRTNDVTPGAGDAQFGLSTQLTLGNYDVGFYALRYNSPAPVVALNSSFSAYQLIYPRDIWIEGSSFSTTLGDANVAGEMSFRQHMNLAQGTVIQGADNNASSNPAYPTGNTWAAQLSTIYVTPGIPLDPGGITFTGEVGMNHLLAVTANEAASAWYTGLHRTNTAAQFQVVMTPTYYNVLPNLQLAFPIGLMYNFYGRSKIDATENHGTGFVNFGVQATYRVTWIASLTYNDNIGAANPNLAGEPVGADRNYILLNLQHSF